VAQSSVVHVDGTGPDKAVGIEMEIVAVEKMRVNERG